MQYTNGLLDDLHDAIFGNGNEPKVDYENRTINYNEDGDTYYSIHTYSGDEVRSILVCAKVADEKDKKKTLRGYREIHIINDNFYTTIDYIIDNLEEINESIDKQMEEQQKLIGK
jgi:hypothetical protein